MSFFLAVRNSFSLLRRDFFLAVPYLILAFLISLGADFYSRPLQGLMEQVGQKIPPAEIFASPVFQKFLPAFFLFAAFSWLLNLLIDALTFAMAQQLDEIDKISFPAAVKRVIRRFLPLIFTSLFTLAIIWLVPAIIISVSPAKLGGLFFVLASALFNFLFLFCPVIVVLEDVSPLKAIIENLKIVRLFFVFVLSFAVTFLLFRLFSLFLAVSLTSLAGLGPTLAILANGSLGLLAKLILFSYWKAIPKTAGRKLNKIV